MIESNSVEVGSGALTRTFAHPLTIENTRSLALTVIVCAALAMRTFALGASGFSEDEINKLQAIRAYAHGQFSANAEHPMMMKLADWASVSLTSRYISPEAALRLPNAIAGAATAFAIFLLAEALFDPAIAVWAALFWAFDANAAAINRIGKEDTFLLLFFLVAAYCFERAKRDGDDRWYNRSGIAFGLMLASKYMPQYFGLHALFNLAADRYPADDMPDKRWPFYAAIGVTFLIANFALVLPATWTYILGYAHGDTVRHTGYYFAGHIWANGIDASPGGTPAWFYVTALATKVSVVTLAAAAAGLVWVARHSEHRGATFVRVFLVFTLIPYSFVASKFLRYLLPVFAVIDIVAAVGVVWILRRIDDEAAKLAVAVALAVTVAASGASAAPYFGLAQNAVANRFVAAGTLFPDDELYDAGVREAVDAIARVAGSHAVICSDATAVVAEYLDRDDRHDITSRSIAHDGIPMVPVETWVLVQDGHTYFENAAVIEGLQRLRPWTDIRVASTSAVRVYRFR
ncbi:MAG TPA: glycosyltransferase family 39 protein [Vicinamibacterales bacterium]|nr:glycosyltransferase family 39 protein [Vicinamibacterales bacterium]